MKVERAALIALLLANAIVLFPFWKNILWASIIAITVWPVNIKLRNFLKNKSVSALALTVGLALIAFSLVVPALIKMYLEGIDLAERIKQINISNVITDLPERINFWGITLNIPYDRLQDLTAFISSKIFPVIIHTLSTAVTTAGSAIVTMILLFFVLRDGEKIPALLSKIGSLLGVQNLAFLSITTSLTRSLVNSCLIVALVQATLSGIGLYIFDVKYSLILSFLMFVLAFTPIGPVLLYIPLSVILAFLDFKSAIGVFFWHAILVSGVDNLLRPFLIARSIPVSDGLLLFSTLGGIMLFGFLGLFVAPILIGLTYHLLNSKNLAFN